MQYILYKMYDHMVEAFEDMEDIRAAAAARLDDEVVTLEELKAEFGL